MGRWSLDDLDRYQKELEAENSRLTGEVERLGKNVMEADSELFTRKLRLVANVTGDETRAVRLSIKKGELHISELHKMDLPELREMAVEEEIEDYAALDRRALSAVRLLSGE